MANDLREDSFRDFFTIATDGGKRAKSLRDSLAAVARRRRRVPSPLAAAPDAAAAAI